MFIDAESDEARIIAWPLMGALAQLTCVSILVLPTRRQMWIFDEAHGAPKSMEVVAT